MVTFDTKTPLWYGLKGKKPIPFCPPPGRLTYEMVSKILPCPGTQVAFTELRGGGLSTTFIGAFNCLFESAIWDVDGELTILRRYNTWRDARKGHYEIARKILAKPRHIHRVKRRRR